MKVSTQIFSTCLAAVMGLLFLGCSGTGNNQAQQISPEGQHPADWQTTHWATYAKTPNQCATCHGSATDPAASGGIVKVTCFQCHHPSGPAHPAGWSAGNQHGLLGAGDVMGDWTGMASCGKCHGEDFTGGIAAISCLTCHTKAPHPDAPWRPTAEIPAPTFTHTQGISATNAPECYTCHANGAHFTGTKPNPPGTGAPGCFNSTMCHGIVGSSGGT